MPLEENQKTVPNLKALISGQIFWVRQRCDCTQVQAIYMYGAAQPDFLKSETNGGIKNIISHHLEIIKRCVF